MAHITPAGASDRNVDPDYIAPPGVAPQDAINAGLPDAGQAEDGKSDEQGTTDAAGTSTRTSGDDASTDAGTGRAKPTTDAGQTKDGKSDSKSGKTTR